MYQNAKLFFLYSETSLHAGSGDASSFMDLPIQREKHTGYPKIESSSLKGAIREAVEEKVGGPTKAIITRLFGPESNPDSSGSLGFTDARLLLFPVKSMKGVMAWITCPRVLRKLESDASLQLPQPKSDLFLENLPTGGIADGNVLVKNDTLLIKSKIMLEEYVFDAEIAKVKFGGVYIGQWIAEKFYPQHANNDMQKFWCEALQNKLVIISDEMFRDFTTYYTEVVTRNRIKNETGTVEEGALFTEEYLPQESILYSLITASPEFTKNINGETAENNMKDFEKKLPAVIQIGGNATIGKGIIRISKGN